MKVYIVEYESFDQSEINAVYDTYEKALEYVSEQFYPNRYQILEWQMNSDYGHIVMDELESE